MKSLHNLKDVQERLSLGEILVDIREKDEWEKGHLPEALFCPLSSLEKGNRFSLNKQQSYLLHCARGGRAQIAQKLLEEDGYKVVAVVLKFEELRALGKGMIQGHLIAD